MSKKNRKNIVYSTNPDFEYETNDVVEEETLPASEQRLRVFIDKKQRAGRVVTLITGFVGTQEDLTNLSKLLKNKCGVGGSAKEGEILIQGEKRAKVIEILQKEGYHVR